MELLVKYIAGEATPDEAIAVEEWIQDTPSNKEQFEELQQVWLAAASQRNAYVQPDAHQDWHVVKKAVEQAPIRNLKTRRMVSYLAAASVTLLVGVLAWLLLKTSNDAMTTLSAQTIQQVQLPDKTLLTLDANSAVIYKKDFSKTSRELTLKGEAFFKVTHNPQKPFIIDMDGVKLQVLGTSFRVDNNLPAKRVDVDVATGRVMLYNELDTLVLTAGQSGRYDRNEKRFIRLASADVNRYSYATKQFAFTDTPLEQVATYLEKTYNVKIQFQNPAIKTCRLSAQFDQQSVEDIIEVIAGTFDITYTVKDHTFYIDGKGCQ